MFVCRKRITYRNRYKYLLFWEIYVLGVQLCFRRFFPKFEALLKKKLVIHLWFKVLSIAGHYFLPSFGQRTNPALKKLVIFWSDPRIDPIFYFFIRPEVLVSQAVCHWSKQVIVRGSNVWRIRRVGVGLSISTFPSMSWPLSQRGVEHCHAVKSLYHVSRCIAAVCLSMLGSNALIAFDNDRLWLFQSVLTTHNTLRRAGPTKYWAWPWNREYSVWPSTSRSFTNSGLTIGIWEHSMSLCRRFLHIKAEN